MSESRNNVGDVGTRVIANSNYDITNVVPIRQEAKRICTTLDHCFSVLAQHCGPRSDYAMLVDNNSIGLDFQPNVFTRDGIGVLQAMEFASPLERYIKELLTYVGKRVDSAAKDGTTTAMMYSAYLLRKYFGYVNDGTLDYESLNRLTFNEKQQLMNDAVDTILTDIRDASYGKDLLDEEKYTESEAMKLAGEIAFTQALSSSGGNLELAKVMKTIFENSPRCTWNYITYSGSIKENDKPFSVEITDFDYSVKCSSGMTGSFNDTLNSEYEAKDIVLYIYADNCNDGDFRLELFLDYLETTAPKDKPIVILLQHGTSRVYTSIYKMNHDRRKCPITLWEYASTVTIGGQSWAWELMILAAQAGVTPVNVSLNNGQPIEGINVGRVHWYGGALHIYDTIPREEGSCLHPYYLHPETAHPYYTAVLNSCKEQLKLYESGHRPDGKAYDYFKDMMSKLMTVRRPSLKLGGTTHEQLANRDVAQDVQGAIMSTLTHGYTTGLCGVNHLLNHRRRESGFNPYYYLLLDALGYVTEMMLHENGCAAEDYLEGIEDKDAYFNVSSNAIGTLHQYFTDVIPKYLQDPEKHTDLTKNYPPIQPLVMYEELFKRVKELLFKFMCSSQIIVSGALLVKEDKEKGE